MNDSQREKDAARREEKAAEPVLKPVRIEPVGFLRATAEKVKKAVVRRLVGKDSIRIHGEAEIRQRGAPGICQVRGCGCGELHIVARNKIVGAGLRSIMNTIAPNSGLGYFFYITNTNTFQHFGLFQTNDQTHSTMKLGLGTAATTEGMTALTGVIATAPNSTATTMDNPSTGVYRTKFTAVWNAGALAVNTITEIGIFAWLTSTFGTYNTQTSGNELGFSQQMFARLTSTDGEFSAFTINTAVPLTVEYRVVLTFV